MNKKLSDFISATSSFFAARKRIVELANKYRFPLKPQAQKEARDESLI